MSILSAPYPSTIATACKNTRSDSMSTQKTNSAITTLLGPSSIGLLLLPSTLIRHATLLSKMLNPFPIQFLALLAYALLRVGIGSILLYLGYTHWKHRHELRSILTLSWWPFGYLSTFLLLAAEVIIGTLLILGAYTQIAALLLMGMCIEMLIWRNHWHHPTLPPKIFYLLLLFTSLSLFITGAGALAFDLPI